MRQLLKLDLKFLTEYTWNDKSNGDNVESRARYSRKKRRESAGFLSTRFGRSRGARPVFHANPFRVISRAVRRNNIKHKKKQVNNFRARQRQEWDNRLRLVLFAANIRDKYRRRFVLANTSADKDTAPTRRSIRCIVSRSNLKFRAVTTASGTQIYNVKYYSSIVTPLILWKLPVTFQIAKRFR